jgi:hypothetical protein
LIRAALFIFFASAIWSLLGSVGIGAAAGLVLGPLAGLA